VTPVANYSEVSEGARRVSAARWMAGPFPDGESGAVADSNAVLARRSQALRGALARFFQSRVRDANEIDDLVQEVFLRVVRRGHCEQLEHLDGYIFQTAASVLQDRGRRRKTRLSDQHVPFEPELHAGTEIAPDRPLMAREGLMAASVILLELPEQTRRIFVLRRLEELSYQEIGLRLGLSVSAVEKNMLRAVRHLVARMGTDK
jgi:RNA polymerase sigma factor (sigma-70 family)